MPRTRSGKRSGGSRRGGTRSGNSSSGGSAEGEGREPKRRDQLRSNRKSRAGSSTAAAGHPRVAEPDSTEVVLQRALGPGVGNNRQVLSGFLTLWELTSMELVASKSKNPFTGILQHLTCLHVDLTTTRRVRWSGLETLLKLRLPHLEGAELKGRDLGPADTQAFGALVRRSDCLKRVHVYGSRLVEHEAIHALARTLTQNHPTLQEIRVHGRICSEPDHSLQCLNTLFSSPPTNLRVLELANGSLGYAGTASIAEAFQNKKLAGLTELSLRDGGLWESGLKELLRALNRPGAAPLLQVLDLRGWAMSPDQAERLCAADLPRLHTLLLRGPNAPDPLCYSSIHLFRTLLDNRALLPSLTHVDLLDDAVLHITGPCAAEALATIAQGWACSRLTFPSQGLSLVDTNTAAQEDVGGEPPLSAVLTGLLSHSAALHPPRVVSISAPKAPLLPALPQLSRLLRLHPPTLHSLTLEAVMSSSNLLVLLQPQRPALFSCLHRIALTFTTGSIVSRGDLVLLVSSALHPSSPVTSLSIICREPALDDDAAAAGPSADQTQGDVAVLNARVVIPSAIHPLTVDGCCMNVATGAACGVVMGRRSCGCTVKKLELTGCKADVVAAAQVVEALSASVTDRRVWVSSAITG